MSYLVQFARPDYHGGLGGCRFFANNVDRRIMGLVSMRLPPASGRMMCFLRCLAHFIAETIDGTAMEILAKLRLGCPCPPLNGQRDQINKSWHRVESIMTSRCKSCLLAIAMLLSILAIMPAISGCGRWAPQEQAPSC